MAENQDVAKSGKKKKKKVLLSIVDPWDDKVANVEPVGVARRRGILIEKLDIDGANSPARSERSSSSCGAPSASAASARRTPWPWYKPEPSPASPRTPPTGPAAATAEAAAAATAVAAPTDVSITEQGQKHDVRERSSPLPPDATEAPLLGVQQRQECPTDATERANDRTNVDLIVEELVLSRYNRRKLPSHGQLRETVTSSGSNSNVSY